MSGASAGHRSLIVGHGERKRKALRIKSYLCFSCQGARMTRDEHLAWCKKRALEYCDQGDVTNAFASFASDMNKHPETENHPFLEIGLQLMMIGELSSTAKMREFINGFN